MSTYITTASYIPLFFEVHVDLAKAGIPLPPKVKFDGKSDPCILSIDPKNKKLSYYTREKSELIWSTDLLAAYHADPMPGTGNGFVIKFRQDKGLLEVNHLLGGCNVDYRQDRDYLTFLIRTTQSREGLMEYYLKKYYSYPDEFTKGQALLKNDDKKTINVVSTMFNTLVFDPLESKIPRRAFLYNTWEMNSEPKKATVTCVWHPPDDAQYKKQRDEWNNKKSRYIFRCESAEQCAQVVQRLTIGRRYLATRPSLPMTVDGLKDEMFEKQREMIMMPNPSSTPMHQTQTLMTSAMSTPTPRRETLSLEQQQLQHQQQARSRSSAAFQQTVALDPLPTPAPSPSPSLSKLGSGGKRSTLFAQAKGTSTASVTTTRFSPIQEDLPPPPPVDEDDPPPPPPDMMSPQSSSPRQQVFSPPPPPPEDDDMPPPPPGGSIDYQIDLPPPPPGSSGAPDSDDEPPPPSGFVEKQKKNNGFKPASELVIQDEIKLQAVPLTPRSAAASIQIPMELPPAVDIDDMPLPALAKTASRVRAGSLFEDQQRELQRAFLAGELPPNTSPSLHHLAPSQPEVTIQVREEGEWVKEIKTEIITDPHTGQRQQRVTESIQHRNDYYPSSQVGRSRGPSLAGRLRGASLADPNPQFPCPVGCKYQYSSKNPLTRQCQLLMEDAVLGVLDPNFKLPFTSTEGQVVYGVLPDESCGLEPNFIITSNGLIVECRVNGIITIDDSVLAQVSTETPIHLLGTSIARQGQTLSFLAQGCVPGSEIEMERFLPPQDEEMPQPIPEDVLPPPIGDFDDHMALPPAPDDFLALPPTPVLANNNSHCGLVPLAPLTPLSLDMTPELSLTTPLATPSAAHGALFHFGVSTGVELTVKIEGQDEPIGVIEIPAEVDPTNYFFNQLREQLLDELDDLPDEFCFLIKGAKLTSKQESKKAVASLNDPTVILRDVQKHEQQKAAEEEAKRLEEERKAKAAAIAAGPGRSAPAPPRVAPRPGGPGGPGGMAPQPPPGAPRGVPPGARPPPGHPMTPASAPPANRPVISMAALQGGASALKKTPIPEDKAKPADLLSQIKAATANKGSGPAITLKKVDHAQIELEKLKRMQRGSVAAGGGMFVSIKAAMASRRQVTVDDAAEDTDDDWD